MKVKYIEPRSHKVYIDDVKSGWEQYFLLTSDNHWDSTKCARKLLKKHFDQAKERDAQIIINGDWFDVMQGKWDPRGNYSDLRPEYATATYLDDVVKDAYEFLKQYKANILIIGNGNHETNITKRHATNLIDKLVFMLNTDKDSKEVLMGAYEGWITFHFNEGGNRRSKRMFYHHGYGGNAPRSKGMLKTDIDIMQHPDADIIIQGHDHNKWYIPVAIERISDNGNIRESLVHRIQLGSYKMKTNKGLGWEVEKNFNQPSLGGWWLKFSSINHEIQIEVTPAT